MKTIRALPTLIIATTLAAAGAAGADAWTSRPAVPSTLAVPDTAKLAAHFHATGAQVYGCAAVPGTTTYAWTLKKPDAKLYDQKGVAAGTHGAGPSWTSKDGSSIVGKKIAQADAPDAGAIPWLLVRVVKTAGDGVLAKVSYVQRVGTKAGKAPATGCDAGAAGAEKRVEYSADYYFYTGGDAG